ncbi:hypothetical protein EV142_10183 [Flavobacterium circumlabens]|uniref:Uncharacterized protein n=1 Tax=Flavobacterium circumlabens TaxID=2133765 RepID=A0ABY2B3D7_9FLAO|nr:hypothetical protein EV142_10183 [Flavobacterium circumlabens]
MSDKYVRMSNISNILIVFEPLVIKSLLFRYLNVNIDSQKVYFNDFMGSLSTNVFSIEHFTYFRGTKTTNLILDSII